MTFIVDPAVFTKLEKQLADSHQVTMAPGPTLANGDESGTLTHEKVQAQYTFTPADSKLIVVVTKGGNWMVNLAVSSRIKDAIKAASAPA